MDNGLIISVMGMASKHGLIVQNTKVIGEMIKQMGMESWFMQTVMFMKESG